MYRVAFNPALPVIAAQPFNAAGQSFASKQPVDWRALGITEQTLLQWWQGGMVTFVEAQRGETADTPPETRAFIIDGNPVTLTAGETFRVETPAQRLTRRDRRALKHQG